VTGDPDTVIAVWVESTWCGTRFDALTADGQVHADGRPPLGEPSFEGEDAPDYNPICGCPPPEALLHGVRRLRRLRAVHRPARLATAPD
jgi:hypothetical protein